MNWKNSIRIFKKDWKLSVRKKEILLPMLILPLAFAVLMPILMLSFVLMDPSEFFSDFPFADLQQLIDLLNIPASYSDVLIAAMLMIRMMVLPFFLFVPGILPTLIASDSFAGEKERKTMESLLLLPVTKTELIMGKTLASLVPSLVINLGVFLLLGVSINLMFLAELNGEILIFGDLTFLLSVLLIAPLLAFLNILVSTIVSSRTKDLKSAQSINGSLIVPIIAILFIQMFNPAFLSPISILIIAGILGGLDILLIDLAYRLLDTEKLILLL
jgi:ABC-type transport system involved in multi-copper enzyme maturation permease subunit